ncbi:MAG: recombination factor protein RarA, partial [Acinetobacter sp.]|nr:recombination factor protein RarA [Acinetobacter sp.]
WKAAKKVVQETGSLAVPKHLRNAPTTLMKQHGHGLDYHYAHDYPNAYVAGERYLPQSLATIRLYQPTDRGLEQRIAQKLERLHELGRSSTWQRGADDPE